MNGSTIFTTSQLMSNYTTKMTQVSIEITGILLFFKFGIVNFVAATHTALGVKI